MNLSRYRHAIWDWNGTLMDDAWLCVEVTNQMLAEMGLPAIDVEKHRALFDFPVSVYYERLGLDLETIDFAEISRDFSDRYNARRTECRLQAGTHTALGYFQRAGVSQHILSAYPQDTLVEIIGHYGLAGYFHRLFGHRDVFGGSKIGRGRECLEALDCDPAEILLIGDTLHDAEVAQALGTDCILLSHGHHSRERLESGTAAVYDTLDEVFASMEVK